LKSLRTEEPPAEVAGKQVCSFKILAGRQGGQIGPIFAYIPIVRLFTLGSFLKSIEVAKNFGLLFSMVKVLLLTGWTTFCAFFLELIRLLS
jgi:hypothetical protein